MQMGEAREEYRLLREGTNQQAPLLTQHYTKAKAWYEQQLARLRAEGEEQMTALREQLGHSRARVVQLLQERAEREGKDGRKGEDRLELEGLRRRVKQLEDEVREAEEVRRRILRGAEIKEGTVQEVSQRNQILSEGVEQMRREVMGARKEWS